MSLDQGRVTSEGCLTEFMRLRWVADGEVRGQVQRDQNICTSGLHHQTFEVSQDNSEVADLPLSWPIWV